jgi:hypothetical protein
MCWEIFCQSLKEDIISQDFKHAIKVFFFYGCTCKTSLSWIMASFLVQDWKVDFFKTKIETFSKMVLFLFFEMNKKVLKIKIRLYLTTCLKKQAWHVYNLTVSSLKMFQILV